jgi:hypothetical protein
MKALGDRLSAVSDVGPQCSVFSRELQIDPIGTAGAYEIFVLVEHALPWPRDIESLPVVAEIASTIRAAVPGLSIRVQAILGTEPVGAQRTVIIYQRGPEPFVSFRRKEGSSGDDDLPQLLSDLLSSPQGTEQSAEGCRGQMDVLVCTHGTRDRCCGSLGTRLWKSMKGLRTARIWRSSHLGGHRFAPTALLLPYGQYWAYLDEQSLASIINQSSEPLNFAGQYRGSAACITAADQAAERAAFVRNGWEWLSWQRLIEDLGDGRVHIHFKRPNGQSGTYEVDTEITRSLPIPVCGEAMSTWSDEGYEVRVTRFQEFETRGGRSLASPDQQ